MCIKNPIMKKGKKNNYKLVGNNAEPQSKQLHDPLLGHYPQVEKQCFRKPATTTLLCLCLSQLDEQTSQFNKLFV